MSDTEEETHSQKDFVESLSFDSLPLKKWLKDQCRLLDFEHPTPVQQACIPRILEGLYDHFVILHIYSYYIFNRSRYFGMC